MAKKFNFRLDPLLKLRNQKVSEAKDLLYQAVNIRIKKDDEITRQNDYLNDLKIANKSTMKLAEIQTLHYHQEYVQKNIENLNKEKEQLLEIEDLRRVKLSESMKEEKVLENLKEKKKNEHNELLKKEENVILDEIGLRKINNQNRNDEF